MLAFDDAARAEYQRLLKAKTRVGTMDLRIAAITIARGALLISRNLSDLRREPGLRAEDWTT